MKILAAYVPRDRRQALAIGEDLPDRAEGAVLMADISDYTSLIESMVEMYGPKHGAEKATHLINDVFGQLIDQVHDYGGVVTHFGGDGLTCWFYEDSGLRATACGLAMQQVMRRLAEKRLSPGQKEPLGIKVSIATGPVRRFRVGHPDVRYLDVLAGRTLDTMAAGEKQAKKGEVVVSQQTVSQLDGKLTVLEWRSKDGSDQQFAVVAPLEPHLEDQSRQQALVVQTQAEPAGLTTEMLQPWILAPIYQQIKEGQPSFMGEYRSVVVLFMRFERLDYDQDDQAGDKLNRYICRAQRILADHNGYLIKFSTGDKGSSFMATFGAPKADYDDPVLAIAAALALRALPQELSFVETVQIGIAWGQMLAANYGSESRRTYDLLGDEATLAVRLMTMAASGQILVNQRTANAVSQRYDLDYRNALQVKGKAYRVPVFQVLGVRPPGRYDFATRLIARQAELDHLGALLGRAKAGQGQLVRLEGAAGVGKSHLAAALAEQAKSDGFLGCIGTCEYLHRNTPYYAWQQILRQLLKIPEPKNWDDEEAIPAEKQVAQIVAKVLALNADWLPLTPLLGDLFDLPIDETETSRMLAPQERQRMLLSLVYEIIQHQAGQQPILLIIDDAQWLDEASQALVLTIGRATPGLRLCFMVIQRPGDEETGQVLSVLENLTDCTSLQLHPLTSQFVAELVADRLSGWPSTLAVSLISTLTQGNPFFIKELVTALRQSGGLIPEADEAGRWDWNVSEEMFKALYEANCLTREPALSQWILRPGAQLSALDLGLPETVQAAVLARIDRLAGSEKLILKVASAIGRPFTTEVLHWVHPASSPLEALQKELGRLAEQDFFARPADGRGWQFKHQILQEVAYSTLLQNQRIPLHKGIAEALINLASDADEEIAHHFWQADLRPEALPYLEKVARKAQRDYANETALSYYNRALSVEVRPEWLFAKVEILHILGHREQEADTLGTLEALPDAPGSKVAYRWGLYYERMSDYPQAQTSFERALEIHRQSGAHLDQVSCLVQLGKIASRQGDYKMAKGWYQQALAPLQTRPPQTDEAAHVLAETLCGLGIVHAQQGRFDEAKTCFEQVLGIDPLHPLDEAQAYNNLGIVARYQLDFVKATDFHRRAHRIRREVGHRAGEASSLFNLGQTMHEAGNCSQALGYLDEVLKLRLASGDRWGEANTRNDLGAIYCVVGDLVRAQSHWKEALVLSRTIGDAGLEAFTLCNLGLAQAGLISREQADLSTAKQCLTQSFQVAQDQGDRRLAAHCYSYLGLVELHAGNPEKAIDYATKALAEREALEQLELLTIDLTTIAEANLARASGDLDEAVRYARRAMAILNSCQGQGPEFPARDYWLCYRVLSAAELTDEAQASLQSAYQLMMNRADQILDPVLRQTYLGQVDFNLQITEAFGDAAG